MLGKTPFIEEVVDPGVVSGLFVGSNLPPPIGSTSLLECGLVTGTDGIELWCSRSRLAGKEVELLVLLEFVSDWGTSGRNGFIIGSKNGTKITAINTNIQFISSISIFHLNAVVEQANLPS